MEESTVNKQLLAMIDSVKKKIAQKKLDDSELLLLMCDELMHTYTYKEHNYSV